jgi:hypothetical protein
MSLSKPQSMAWASWQQKLESESRACTTNHLQTGASFNLLLWHPDPRGVIPRGQTVFPHLWEVFPCSHKTSKATWRRLLLSITLLRLVQLSSESSASVSKLGNVSHRWCWMSTHCVKHPSACYSHYLWLQLPPLIIRGTLPYDEIWDQSRVTKVSKNAVLVLNRPRALPSTRPIIDAPGRRSNCNKWLWRTHHTSRMYAKPGFIRGNTRSRPCVDPYRLSHHYQHPSPSVYITYSLSRLQGLYNTPHTDTMCSGNFTHYLGVLLLWTH